MAGCGGAPGRAGEAVRPEAPTAAKALGEKGASQCEGVVERAEPLVIDWTSDDRIDLELAMKKSVAVVSYDCASIKLLKECKVQGDYGFIGVSKKERVVKLESSDEITANLPMQGMSFVAKLGAELERGASLDLALVMIGKKRTTLESVTRKKLVGQCDGATHFVRGATIGAFAMASGSKGRVATVTEIFGGGASTDSGSKRFEHNTDGERTACGAADPEAAGPPKQCQSALRLELSAIGDSDVVAVEKPSAAPEATACPPGMVSSEGVCSTPKEKQTHLCKTNDIVDCATQCERGHAGSCRVLGFIHEFQKKEHAKATEYYVKACDSDDAKACSNAGYMFNKGRGVPENPARGRELYVKGCDLGDARGCTDLGLMYETGRGTTADAALAAKLYKRGCDGGNMLGCGNYGHVLQEGLGVAKDPNLALTYFTRGCVAGDARSCNGVAFLYEFGKGAVPADMTKATEYYVKACSTAKATGYGAACANAGFQHLNGRGVAKDAVKAYQEFEAACSMEQARGCAYLGYFYEKGEGGKAQDMAKARQYYEQGCKAGYAWGCAQAKKLP